VLKHSFEPDAPADSDAGDTAFPRTFGTYELLGEIGRGGIGLVFKARQPTLDRLVALKVLLTGRYADDVSRRRFRFEAEAVAQLQHPNIVTMHEVGEVDGQPYLTMDFVDGPNLAEHCRARPLSAREAARLAREVTAAIEAAHAHGVLHRDLKPSNVLLGPDGRPRVTDFGLAKRAGDTPDLTAPGQLVGSPNYLSPEQATGGSAALTTASDVYGLGALLYHLLTGRAPFNASTPAATVRLVLEAAPTPPRQLNPAVPRDLETICLKCLEKDPARRYPSAAEVGDELDRFLAGEPVRARRVSAAESLWRACRRRPAVATLSLVAISLLVITTVISVLAARRIGQAQVQEHTARLAAEDSLYAADMEVIGAGFQAALGASPRDSRARLDAWRPAAGERDLRGFEWRHYWTRTRGDAAATFAGHRHMVDAVTTSPDNTQAASLSRDGAARIWTLTGPRELRRIDDVDALGGFSSDGRELYVGRRSGEIARFDVTTGTTTLARPATGRLIGVMPDGRQAVVFGPGFLPVLRALDPAAPAETTPRPPPGVLGVLTPDGRRVAVAGRPHREILVFEPATGRRVAAIVDPRPVIAIALSPDGRTLVSGGFDALLKVWDVERGVLLRTFRAFLDPAWGLAFSADGKWFSAGGHNRDVKVWDTATWEPRHTFSGHASTILCLAFSPDGRNLISGAEDEQAKVWSLTAVRPPDELRRALRGSDYGARTPGLAFSPDGALIAGTAADQTIQVWRAATLERVTTIPAEVRSVAFSASGRSIIGEGFAGEVRTWSLDSARPDPTAATSQPPAPAMRDWLLDPLTSEQRLAQVAGRQSAQLPCSLCEIPSFRDGIVAGVPVTISTLAASPDGATVWVGRPDGHVEIWDTASRQRRLTFAAHKVPVTALALSPDGLTLATGSLDNSTGLWDAATGRELARLYRHNRPVWALAFSPDSRTLAAGSCDKAIVLINVVLRRIVSTLPVYTGLPEGHEQEIRLLRFSPDGNALAAALGDGTIRLFRAEPFTATDADAPPLHRAD